MLESSLEDRSDAPTALAERPRPGDCAPCAPRPPISQDDIARFARDPIAFAVSAGAPVPDAFVKAYLTALEKRLDGTVGSPPRERVRLATLATATLPIGDLVEQVEGRRDDGAPPDLSPRMGPILVLAAVSTVAAVASAAAAVYTAMTKRCPM